VNRGEVYRTQEKVPERGNKPGFYVVVSRDFVASNDDISSVICAPVYREALGLRSEVIIGPGDGVPQDSSIRCDFLTLMFKTKLTHFVATLSKVKRAELDRALIYALLVGIH
jgi:mRNA-degrading endonuclease toxin of MazEF toxin-antitoxin module